MLSLEQLARLDEQLVQVEDPSVGGVVALGCEEESFVNVVPLLFSVGPAALRAERL